MTGPLRPVTVSTCPAPINGAAAAPRADFGAVPLLSTTGPKRILIYGLEGLGKSTLCLEAELPIWIATEHPRVPCRARKIMESFAEVLAEIHDLEVGAHDFRTVVVDTIDALEGLIWQHICREAGVARIEAVGGGFGKGYVAALEEWARFRAALERLMRVRGMDVILLGHCVAKTCDEPGGRTYDRYSLRLFETKTCKPGAALRGWCDAVLFAAYEMVSARRADGKRTTWVDTGARLLYTQWHAEFDAKNRFDLPPIIPMAWDDLAAAIGAARPAEIGALQDLIVARTNALASAPAGAVAVNFPALRASIEAAGDDAAKLAKVADRLAGKLASLGLSESIPAATAKED